MMLSLISAVTGDPVGPDPATPIGTGTKAVVNVDQGASWQFLLLLFAISLLLGAAVLMFAVVQRTRFLARRRARLYGSAVSVAGGPAGSDKAFAILKADWQSVAGHTARFCSRTRTKAPEVATSIGEAWVGFKVRLKERAAAERVKAAARETFPEKVPTSALAIAVRPDARAHQGERTRVSA
jgi:hypothetical protein